MKSNAIRIVKLSTISLFLVGTAGLVVLLNPPKRAPLAIVVDGELLGTTTFLFDHLPARPSGTACLLARPDAKWQAGPWEDTHLQLLFMRKGQDSALRRGSAYRLRRPYNTVLKELHDLSRQNKAINLNFVAVRKKNIECFYNSMASPASVTMLVELHEDVDPQCCLIEILEDRDITPSDRLEAFLRGGYNYKGKPFPETAITDMSASPSHYLPAANSL